jgi:hypothetical protein
MGNETKVPMNDWIDIGVLDSEEKNLVYKNRVKINQPEMTFILELDSLPVKAAIDPRRLLIDRVYDDNVKVASEQ